MPEVKQYGLHRSGTNFVRVILQENYRVTVLMNEGGWKHGFYDLPAQLGRELDCLLCVKDPYAWLVSFYNFRNPDRKLAFGDFVKSPLKVTEDERAESLSAADPISLWVQMYEHWLGIRLAGHRLFVFRYEQALDKPEESVRELVEAMGLQRRRPWHWKLARACGFNPPEPTFFVPEVALRPLHDRYKGKHLKQGATFDAARYRQRRYMNSFTPYLLDFVNERLKPDLLLRLGYEPATAKVNRPGFSGGSFS